MNTPKPLLLTAGHKEKPGIQASEAIPLVSDTHNSRDYIAFLKNLNDRYPKGTRYVLSSII